MALLRTGGAGERTSVSNLPDFRDARSADLARSKKSESEILRNKSHTFLFTTHVISSLAPTIIIKV